MGRAVRRERDRRVEASRRERIVRSGSPLLDELSPRSLVNKSGQTYDSFCAALVPYYGRTILALAGGYISIAVTVATVLIVHPSGFDLMLFLAASILLGCSITYIQNFFHAAVHFNLAKTSRMNDRLANALCGILVGQEITIYRRIHLAHHRYLGTAEDPERKYASPLNLSFLVEWLFGWGVVGSIKEARSRASQQGRAGRSPGGGRQLILGGALHVTMVGGAAWAGCWTLAASWATAILIVYPFLASLRQLLEHREERDAEAPIGVVSRTFRGPFATILGAAGFNRHLLHHWAPGVHYTCLRQLEGFLMETAAAPALVRSTSTYTQTFLRLMRADAGSARI